jgi:hypothetical protein
MTMIPENDPGGQMMVKSTLGLGRADNGQTIVSDSDSRRLSKQRTSLRINLNEQRPEGIRRTIKNFKIEKQI